MQKKRKSHLETCLPSHICTICGKQFVILRTNLWAYKIQNHKNIKYYCSYKCYRKAGGDNGKFTKWESRIK